MYCTLVDREVEIEKAKEMLGGKNKRTEELIESANDVFTKERMRNNTSPRRIKMYPDEYPFNVGVDSSEYLIKELGLHKIDSSFIAPRDKFITLTGTDDPYEAQIKLNDTFRDKLFTVVKSGNDFIISFEDKPTEKFKEKSEIDSTVISPKNILNLIDRLVKYHGIKFNYVSNIDVANMENAINASRAKGFILNGDIYINTDNCTIDTEVHELMHLFLGAVRLVDPKLYFDTIQVLQQNPELQNRLQEYSFKSESDALEEVFVEEYSKYLTGQENLLSNLSEDIVYDLNYNIRRLLDTMFMGDFSNKIIPDNVLPHLSMLKLGKIVNSKYIYSNYSIDSTLHRKEQNLKENLLRSGKLIKEC